MKIQSLAFFFLFFLNRFPGTQTTSSAQTPDTTPFALGITHRMYSTQLAETRILNVYLPENYSTDTAAKYPVVYLLDGSANEDFIHIAGLVQFLTMIQSMPNTIVVGIANVDRKRDLTFPTTIEKDKKDYPTTGGSEKFMAFIQQELQPFIQTHYRVNESRTLLGQSLGGLFATEVLLKKPELFSDYIIVSPSLWWDHESLLAKAPALLKTAETRKIRVFLSVGSEGTVMETDAGKLAELLKGALYAGNQNLLYVPMPEENHATILHRCAYKAFEALNSKN